MMNPDGLPRDGDWLLYLCSAHKSPSMRARSWIWVPGEELRRAFLEKKAGGECDDIQVSDGKTVKGPGRQELEQTTMRNPILKLFLW